MRAESLLHVLAAALVGSAALLATTAASPFCRTTVQPRPPGEPTDTCWSEGAPLYHPSQCVPYHLASRESAVIPNAVLSENLSRAFGAWTATNPTCTPGITTIELGPVDEPIVFYPQGGPATNVVGVVDEWVHEGPDGTLALTTLVYKVDTGEILDFGLELNEKQRWSFSETTPVDGIDLESVLVHEVGHALGFAHAEFGEGPRPDPLPVMFDSYVPGATARMLTADDQQAVCWVYPNRTQRMATAGLVPSTACGLGPSTSTPSNCEPQITHGCSLTTSVRANRAGAWSLLLGAALALGALARRKQRSR